MAPPNPLFVINGPDSTIVVRISGAQLNTMNSVPVQIMPGVDGRLVVPTRLLDAFYTGSTSFAGTFAGTWAWMYGTTGVQFGCSFGLMVNAATLADDLESQADWDPACNTDGAEGAASPLFGLLPGLGQPLMLQNDADFTGSQGIASSNLNAGGAGYAVGDTFNVTGGGGSGAAGVVDSVVNGVFPIIEVDISANVVVVEGDQTAHFTALDSVTISDSAANDGTYTVTSATLTMDGNTAILLVELLVNATAPLGNITSVDNGAVLTYHITSSGTGYSVTIGAATTHTSGSGDDNFTIDINTVGDGNGWLDLLLEYRILKRP